MTQKLRILLVLLLLSALTLSGLAFQVTAPLLQIDTPTPEPERPPDKDDIADLIAQAGSTDGITFLGFVIFLIILIPLLTIRKDW